MFTLLGGFTEDGTTRIPPPSLQFMRNLLGLAWREDTAAALRVILEEARHHPGRDGLAKALRSARTVWRDVLVEAQPKRRGPKRKNEEVRDFRACVAFSKTLADLQRDGKKRYEDLINGYIWPKRIGT